MKTLWAMALSALTIASLAYAGGNGSWGDYRPINGTYLIYSNTLDELQPPTPHDRKISFMVTAAVAKDMFDSMAPDSKDRCSLDKGYRERNKENISCSLDQNGYVCHFGFNLRSGKSMAGAICQVAVLRRRQTAPASASYRLFNGTYSPGCPAASSASANASKNLAGP